MNCEQVELELLGYHFGTVSLETRAELERHLPGCPRCLNAFFALKRELETQPELPPPSDAARTRLRAAVAAEVRGRPWQWWERPVAIAAGVAAALVAFVLTYALATGQVETRLLPPPGAAAARSPDTVERLPG